MLSDPFDVLVEHYASFSESSKKRCMLWEAAYQNVCQDNLPTAKLFRKMQKYLSLLQPPVIASENQICRKYYLRKKYGHCAVFVDRRGKDVAWLQQHTDISKTREVADWISAHQKQIFPAMRAKILTKPQEISSLARRIYKAHPDELAHISISTIRRGVSRFVDMHKYTLAKQIERRDHQESLMFLSKIRSLKYNYAEWHSDVRQKTAEELRTFADLIWLSSKQSP